MCVCVCVFALVKLEPFEAWRSAMATTRNMLFMTFPTLVFCFYDCKIIHVRREEGVELNLLEVSPTRINWWLKFENSLGTVERRNGELNKKMEVEKKNNVEDYGKSTFIRVLSLWALLCISLECYIPYWRLAIKRKKKCCFLVGM